MDKDFFVAQNDNVLFATQRHEIYYFDADLRRDIFVTRLPEDFSLQGWYALDGHFVFSQQKNLKLADLDFMNVYDLPFNRTLDQVYLRNSALYFFNNRTLNILSFIEPQ